MTKVRTLDLIRKTLVKISLGKRVSSNNSKHQQMCSTSIIYHICIHIDRKKPTPPPRGFFFFGDFQLYSKKLVLLFRVRPRPVGSAFGNHTKKNTTGGSFQSTCTYQLTFESLQKSAGMCKCRAKRDQQRQCRVKRDQQHMSPVARHLQQRMSLLTPHM